MFLKQRSDNKHKGFTLLEMLIVMSIVALILPTVFAIVFVIMRQQVRIYRVVETRRQGDFILSFIKDKLIRSKEIASATAPYPSYCTSVGGFQFDGSGNNVSFVDQNNQRYQIYVPAGSSNLSYTSGILNNANTSITEFNIDCYRSATNSTPLITVSFRIQYKDDTPTTQEGTVSLRYQTKVRLRE